MEMPLLPGVEPMDECPFELMKNVYWRASMSVTG